MHVNYYRTDDGVPESCDAVYVAAADEKLECYHTECKIKKGEPYYRLVGKDGQIMNFCEKCYEWACFNKTFSTYLNGKKMSDETYCKIIDLLLHMMMPPKIETVEQGLIIEFPNEKVRMLFPFE